MDILGSLERRPNGKASPLPDPPSISQVDGAPLFDNMPPKNSIIDIPIIQTIDEMRPTDHTYYGNPNPQA